MRALVSFLIACVLAIAGDRAQEAQLWNDAGLAFHSQGRHSEAERAYSKAIRIAEENPGNWQVLVDSTQNLASVLLEGGASVARAEQLLRRALEIGIAGWGSDAPELRHILTHLGAALMEQGRLTEADEYFQRALPKAHGDQAAVAALQSNMGVLAYRQHNASAAIEHFLKAIAAWEGRREGVRSLFNLGALYLELHRNIDAESVLRKAVETAQAHKYDNAEMSVVLRHYALALRRNGKKDESTRAKERSQAFSPSRDYTVHVSDLAK
jgi:tetratricopeptide (TPR) repeat protein